MNVSEIPNPKVVASTFFSNLPFNAVPFVILKAKRSRKNGKGGKERRVYINEKTNLYLKEYLQGRTDTDPALFVSLKGGHERLSKSGIEDIIRRIGKRANVEKAHPHRFRRTALTNALNRGMPLQEAMILAGHSKPETTMRYCTVDQEAVQYHHKKYLSA